MRHQPLLKMEKPNKSSGKFHDYFHGSILNPVEGLAKLHSLLLRDLVETEEMLALIKMRIHAEENYSSALLDLKSRGLSQDGFRRDETRLSSGMYAGLTESRVFEIQERNGNLGHLS